MSVYNVEVSSVDHLYIIHVQVYTCRKHVRGSRAEDDQPRPVSSPQRPGVLQQDLCHGQQRSEDSKGFEEAFKRLFRGLFQAEAMATCSTLELRNAGQDLRSLPNR